jgi:hypothetical protein
LTFIINNGVAKNRNSSNYVSSARETISIIKGTGGTLFTLTVNCKNSANAVYLQLHNAATATTPVTGTIKLPLGKIYPGQTRKFEIDGVSFSNGIKLAESSTEDSYTAAGETALWSCKKYY